MVEKKRGKGKKREKKIKTFSEGGGNGRCKVSKSDGNSMGKTK